MRFEELDVFTNHQGRSCLSSRNHAGGVGDPFGAWRHDLNGNSERFLPTKVQPGELVHDDLYHHGIVVCVDGRIATVMWTDDPTSIWDAEVFTVPVTVTLPAPIEYIEVTFEVMG